MRRPTHLPGAFAPGRLLRGISLSEGYAVVAVLFPVLVITGTRLYSVDLAYQLRAGELMLDSDALIRIDSFTSTASGLPWANQQWLAQILLALGFRSAGWLGLALIRALLAGLVLLLIYLAARALGASRWAAGGLTLAAGVVLPGGFQLRPQLFGMVCFAVVVWLLARRKRHPRSLMAVPLVAAAWANLHGSFVFAPVLVALAWVGRGHRDREQGGPIALTAVASLLATLVNPLGFGAWTYAYDLIANPLLRRVVSEWQPPTIRSYTGIVFFASTAGVAVLLARLGREVPLHTFLILGFFWASALFATRGVYWWAIVAPVAVAPVLANRPARPRPDPVNALNTAATILVVVGGFFAVLFPWLSQTHRTTPGERFLGFAPLGITQALEEVLEPGDIIYNAQWWGSWLELRFPENPVTTDSRFEVIPDHVWELDRRVSNGTEGWQDILDTWQVDVAAVARKQQPGLIPRIRSDPTWRVIYEDEEGLVLVRN